MARVLLVEDNEMNRDMLTRRLERSGFEVELAANGQEALDCIGETMVDLVIMDMRMPVLDGWKATQEIRKRDETSHIPVIGLSANAMEGDREACLEAGADDYLAKPILGEALVDVLARVGQSRS